MQSDLHQAFAEVILRDSPVQAAGSKMVRDGMNAKLAGRPDLADKCMHALFMFAKNPAETESSDTSLARLLQTSCAWTWIPRSPLR